MRSVTMKFATTLFCVAHKQHRQWAVVTAFTTTHCNGVANNNNNILSGRSRIFGGSKLWASSSSTTSTLEAAPVVVPVAAIPAATPVVVVTPLVVAPVKINLHTIKAEEFRTLLKSWGNYPEYRADQILHWVREKGVLSFDDMNNIPKKLRQLLKDHADIGGTLELEVELKSKDGTIKRAYRLWDGQLIESVLMPYEDGRNTACISSQAGCAMGCVFCATGQMGFARQLTPDEIFEQVARFASELKAEDKRLSNVVMMGMGEPLANYRNVMEAIGRMNHDLGIGARKITVSTVGIVPNIRKLMTSDLQVRLAVSLHCSTEEERSALLPANKRYGGLDTLMRTIQEYIDTTKRRVTFEWALIENQNDTPDVARQLGRLLQQYNIRRDMVHVNLIPLNPTGGYGGSPSGKSRVYDFVKVLDQEFGVVATPRMRRGIDIEAGCGQLKAAVQKKEIAEQEQNENLEPQNNDNNNNNIMDETSHKAELMTFMDPQQPAMVGVYEDDYDDDEQEYASSVTENSNNHDDFPMETIQTDSRIVEFTLDSQVVDLDDEDDENDFDDPEYITEFEMMEAERLLKLVTNSFLKPIVVSDESKYEPSSLDTATTATNNDVLKGPTTSITNEDSLREAKRRRKKLLKNLKAIEKLKEKVKQLSDQEAVKISKEQQWRDELESVEHNLQ
eukprot:CAMPEP_0197837970 /NCGR_PEP_ID=MMETSP1437-20131217/33946_1 /TAXON_ID=49252 ORGANISM="Eucampia antarctica, Strain CCMP1452" /NCGR_SAMPLE_ID=MMETSP1437 /ASSEMBLY_ACC=CAM_ASM_001096 /LENGTH=674 /DNA_ID=CAMNT_0043445463 /DNA_START=40 /DNA_END=2064 /DNA_ORIENTATION=-